MPLEIPEFADWKVKQPCVERMQIIRELLDGRIGKVVDVGCHTGWFCREFARDGWCAVGIDRSNLWIEVANAMNSTLTSNHPTYVCGSVQDVDLPQSDVLLFLSTVMYFFRDLEEQKAWKLIRKLSDSALIMFLDCGGQYAKHLPFYPDDAVAPILDNTNYERGIKIGKSDFEERPIFAFYR